MKSPRLPTEDKALTWYVQKNDYRPQLSPHPIYYFKDRQGNEVKVQMQTMVDEYRAYMKEQKRNAKDN